MLLLDAMDGEKISRSPSVPKIYIDLAANLLKRDILEVLYDPELASRTVVEAAVKCNCDGARIFFFPGRDIRKERDKYYQYKNGKRFGKVDMQGGLTTICDDPSDIDYSDPETMICHNFFNSEKPIINDINGLKRFHIPSKNDYIKFFGSHIDSAIKTAGNSCCPMGFIGNGTLHFCIYMLGMENALVSLHSNPFLIHALMDIISEIIIVQAQFLIDKGIRILRLGDSAANMTVISPSMWRNFIKPQFTKICKAVHEYSRTAKIYCHICGDVRPVINDLIESGIDCIAPLDPMGNVTVAEARKLAGNSYMLMGGVNTLSFINKTPEEITAEAEKCIRDGFTGNGHFAVGSGCVVPRNAKIDALKALSVASFNTGREQGDTKCTAIP